MQRTLIWDLPVRTFHAVFSLGILAAVGISLGTDDDGPLFPYHSMIGLVVGVALALRVVWGLVGSRYARFGSFAFGPAAIGRFLRAAASGRPERHPGHNPAAAVVMWSMFVIAAGLVATGVMLGLGGTGIKEVHEILAYAMLAAIAAHLAGLALHAVTHRELIAASMLDGRKRADPAEAIGSSHPLVGLAFAVIVVAVGVALRSGYDPTTATVRLPLVGAQLRLGEVEGEREHEHADHD